MTRPTDEMAAFQAQELLIKRVSEGLSEVEASQLEALGAERDASLDLAMASLDIATLESVEDLPAGVADKILVAAGVGRSPRTSAMQQRSTPESPIGDELAAARAERRRSRSPAYAAYVAAAASIVLAIGAFRWARGKPSHIIDRVTMRATPGPAAARAALIATARDVVTLGWTATQDPAGQGASGDVVWSASQQKGFMRFVGLAVNDPGKVQYQLWIFDKNRDQAFPVDGGVFDVAPGGEIVVPIDAKLPVAEPVLFAVTIEKPGGVVVSKRERIVVTAAPSA